MWKARLSGALFTLPLLLLNGSGSAADRSASWIHRFRAEILLRVVTLLGMTSARIAEPQASSP
jgi:hypothetical protein